MTDLDALLACGYLTAAPDGTIEHVNERLLAMTGYGRDEVLAHRRFTDLLSPGARIFYDTHLAPLLRVEGRAKEIAVDVVRRDGTRLPVLVNAVAERGDDGELLRLHVAVFDASDRRSYERELLAATRRAEASEARAVELARTLQATLVPPQPPTIAGLDVATAYRPAGDGHEVGGDFFDVFETTIDEWYVIAGDVSGKGVGAAVVASRTRRALRELALRHGAPSDLLHAVNAELHGEHVVRYCTVVVTRLTRNAAGWRVEVSTGGHPHPLLLRGPDVRSIGRPGSLIGALPEAHFETVVVDLAAGDVLLLFTDGVTEGRRGHEFYGDDRLAGLLRSTGPADAAEVVRGVLADVMAFQDDRPRDDIVVVGVGVPARAAGAP